MTTPSDAPLLRVQQVSKSFGERTVLDHVDLEVPRGAVVTLIGSSGSGKSTLLRTLNLLEPIDDGQIFLDGRDITDPRVNPDEVRRDIGVVFQAYNLFPHLRVRDNVALALVRVHRKSKAQARELTQAALERVGMGDFADAFPDRLSGGQQQRVAIARAVVTAPKLLLLDEVTSALDPELVGEVLALIQELAATDITIVMATHEMSFAREVSTQVCFLDGGVIAEKGAPATIFGNPQQPRTREFLARMLPTR